MDTREVRIGNRVIGGGNPVLIQSMTNTKTEDVQPTVAQIKRLTAAGCEIIRCAVPTIEAAKALGEIKRQIEIPLVADIHFDYKLAIAAMENGADKIRINPGNIGSKERIRAVVDVFAAVRVEYAAHIDHAVSGDIAHALPFSLSFLSRFTHIRALVQKLRNSVVKIANKIIVKNTFMFFLLFYSVNCSILHLL